MDGAKILATDGTSPVEGFKPPWGTILITDSSGELHLFLVLSSENVVRCTKVQSQPAPAQIRSPDAGDLKSKKVGIVGLGSAGSKIAMSLLRMGVRKFYLVDHDVLLPENLQRHVLDWESIAQHKVDAITVAMKRVAADVQVEVCRLHLAGQESNAAFSGALNALGECDLIIDATAEPKVFNVLAAVARTVGRPMIWLEVFGGGLGGMVARSRPELDPTPQDMRGAYLQFCTDNPDASRTIAIRNYEAETDDGRVLVASDSDVAVIAHHAAHFAADCFVPSERARFPHSMYLIGLAKGWVFEAPFVNIPISMASFSTSGWGNGKGQEISPENLLFLVQLLPKDDNATSPAT
jgi:molybdopterin/thiamine biosynthesis adenylyltransferase